MSSSQALVLISLYVKFSVHSSYAEQVIVLKVADRRTDAPDDDNRHPPKFGLRPKNGFNTLSYIISTVHRSYLITIITKAIDTTSILVMLLEGGHLQFFLLTTRRHKYLKCRLMVANLNFSKITCTLFLT